MDKQTFFKLVLSYGENGESVLNGLNPLVCNQVRDAWQHFSENTTEENVDLNEEETFGPFYSKVIAEDGNISYPNIEEDIIVD